MRNAPVIHAMIINASINHALVFHIPIFYISVIYIMITYIPINNVPVANSLINDASIVYSLIILCPNHVKTQPISKMYNPHDSILNFACIEKECFHLELSSS